ncbi:MAG: competence/damage-inducible protein A [Hyphomicrobiaceae bacterium]
MAEDNMTTPAEAEKNEVVSAALLVIGDEILSGRTKDKNISFIADYLTALGIRLLEVRIVPDVEVEIVSAVDALRARYTYLFTTGGIGPTHDDITADSIAKALGVGIDVDQRALDLMKPYYERRELELTPSRLRMARIPFGAKLIQNKVSIAPGFMIENVVVMAGVPSVMQVMLDDAAQYLKVGRKMLSQTIPVERPEGDIADMLGEHQNEYTDVSIGSYPSFRDGRMRCEIVLRCVDADRLNETAVSLRKKIDNL